MNHMGGNMKNMRENNNISQRMNKTGEETQSQESNAKESNEAPKENHVGGGMGNGMNMGQCHAGNSGAMGNMMGQGFGNLCGAMGSMHSGMGNMGNMHGGMGHMRGGMGNMRGTRGNMGYHNTSGKGGPIRGRMAGGRGGPYSRGRSWWR